jgi:hypothetical protein
MRTMGFVRGGLVALLLAPFVTGMCSPAAAEPRTSKERLSDKASDDQRLDNCGVPAERRGPVARPNCADEAETSVPTQGQGSRRTAPSR